MKHYNDEPEIDPRRWDKSTNPWISKRMGKLQFVVPELPWKKDKQDEKDEECDDS